MHFRCPTFEFTGAGTRRCRRSKAAALASGGMTGWANRQERSHCSPERQDGHGERTPPTAPLRQRACQRRRTTRTTGSRAAASAAGTPPLRARWEAAPRAGGEGDALARSHNSCALLPHSAQPYSLGAWRCGCAPPGDAYDSKTKAEKCVRARLGNSG